VPTNGTPTLDEMFKEEFKPEEIEGYECTTCGPKRQTARKTVSIWRLPYYLVIVLKRFTFDGRKIQTPIAPLPMNGVQMSFQQFFSPESPEYKGDLTYSLHSIVDHHGHSGGGHYNAQCKSAGDMKWHVPSQRWHTTASMSENMKGTARACNTRRRRTLDGLISSIAFLISC
jgi:ubiquitin C-terminal hydrolase